MASKVNLDALVPREDFEVIDRDLSTVSTFPATLSIREVEDGGFLYPRLRKPDFQRETSEWDIERICNFIESFLSGDLIPAVIFWDSGSFLFVIDGAHRLSALIAWVHDDYGDGPISKEFFEHIITEEQIKVAERCRRAVKRRIGNYRDLQFAARNPEKASQNEAEYARKLGSLAIQLQWVKGDAGVAENSFFNINQNAAPINKTELKLLKSRNQPNAVAARSIIRGGKGHKYWSKFDTSIVKEIEENAKLVNEVLFMPPLNKPIKTTHLPIAGRSYSSQSLPLVFDLVNLANNIPIDKNQEIDDDIDGTQTIQFLKNVKKLVFRLSGTHPSSLGFHPALYFYSPNGRHQPVSFLAMILLIQEFAKQDFYDQFTEIRAKFEEFLSEYRTFPSQVNIKYRGGYKGAEGLQELYWLVLNVLVNGGDVIETLRENERFSFLNFSPEINSGRQGRAFTESTKSAAYLRDALNQSLRCKICGGLMYSGSISIDHKMRKSDGGTDSVDNAQLSHLYCNTNYKN